MGLRRRSHENTEAAEHSQESVGGVQQLPRLRRNTDDSHNVASSDDVDVFRAETCHIHSCRYRVEHDGDLL